MPVATLASPLPATSSRACSRPASSARPSCGISAPPGDAVRVLPGEALGRDALDVGAERTEALVDALVPAVDLADVPDRRRSLRAQGRQQHRHPGADVGARHLLTVEPGRAGDDRSMWVAEDDPRAHRDELVDEEQAA